jgi:hypothetical protein
MDPKVERPEERVFKRNLRDYVLKNRVDLVWAALTLLRAYRAAGQPKQDFKPSRFPVWDAQIRSVVIWAGFGDPMLTRAAIDATDYQREHAVAVLSAWRNRFREEWVSVRRLVEAAQRGAEEGPAATLARSELRNALLDIAADKNSPDNINANRVGVWCRKHKNRIYAGLQLVDRDEVTHGGGRRWRVDVVETANTSTESGAPPQPSAGPDSEDDWQDE